VCWHYPQLRVSKRPVLGLKRSTTTPGPALSAPPGQGATSGQRIVGSHQQSFAAMALNTTSANRRRSAARRR
jgi:hypothetical protein